MTRTLSVTSPDVFTPDMVGNEIRASDGSMFRITAVSIDGTEARMSRTVPLIEDGVTLNRAQRRARYAKARRAA